MITLKRKPLIKYYMTKLKREHLIKYYMIKLKKKTFNQILGDKIHMNDIPVILFSSACDFIDLSLSILLLQKIQA